MRPKILLVDDDENILEGYKRSLYKNYDVITAGSGQEGIGKIKSQNDFTIVVSDFRMPGINGVEFLSEVKKICPDTIRVLLTGFADAQTTITAVNEGNIFRLLTKPCSQEHLLTTLADAHKQYQLVQAEKELLDKTLKGSIKILIDILSIVDPVAFKISTQMRNIARKIADRLGLKNIWDVEIAALLSHIGSVAIPGEIISKYHLNKHMTEEEKQIYHTYPTIGSSLLKNIPRLESISTIIEHQLDDVNTLKEENKFLDEEIKISSMILRVLNDYYSKTNQGSTSQEAFLTLKKNEQLYDMDVIVAFDVELAGVYEGLRIVSVMLNQLTTGHVLADDVRDSSGTILITRGAEISEISRLRLLNYNKMNSIEQPLRVFSVM